MNPRILEGGGLLGGYSFDRIEAEPETNLTAQNDGDVVAAVLRLQCASEEYRRVMSGEDRLRYDIESLRSVRTVFAGNMPTAWIADLACELEQLEWRRSGLARKLRDRRVAPLRSIQTAVLRIFACTYMSLLVRAGMRVPEADAAVKRRMKSRFRQVGIQLGRYRLINWRKDITRDTTDAEIYRGLLKMFDSQQRPMITEIEEWVDSWIDSPIEIS
jgi:hypothetical protein